MLKKFQDMGKLIKQAKEMKDSMKDIQAELKKTKIPVSTLKGGIKLVMNGELEIVDFKIDESLLTPENSKKLQKGITLVFGEGIKKAKNLATTKLSAISGGLMGG